MWEKNVRKIEHFLAGQTLIIEIRMGEIFSKEI
jgi:hypothetical protein